ncbi:MAG: peptide chain release factor N(5)-glutamine methyltransferase [Oscillospiraceae bacterium]|nr:peptide chain release factor N(5)-glutamine methyltransferase [Oscillospiraceae bacterium]
MTGNAGLLNEITRILCAGGIEDAPLEAKWILEDAADEAAARKIAERRAAHEPLQYLLGKWEFYGLPVYVGEGVLIPRADTETLVDAVLERKHRLPESPAAVDLCTGSGCIALALKRHLPDLMMTGIDKSKMALTFAERNAAENGLDVQWFCDDVTAPELTFDALDLIVCNPPYLTAGDMENLQTEVAFEPQEALYGGEDGLDFYRRITAVWRDSLRCGGMIAYEVGCTQAEAVSEILAENGFAQIEIIRDLNGNERVVLGCRKS